jgi:hypothetical protein
VALHAAALDAELWDAARRAFTRANARRLAVRAVALTLDRLEEAEGQLELWEAQDAGEASHPEQRGSLHSAQGDSPARARALQHAIDRIRGRWGGQGLVRGTGVLDLSDASSMPRHAPAAWCGSP